MALEYIKKALKKGRSDSLPADPNEAAYVLLPYVVQNQFRPVIELLNNSNFDVNHTFGRAQRTLLHSAANTGAIDSLLFLLKKGAIVNVQDRIGVTPLHLAARNGHKKCVQRLVECGADISIHDNEGLTALHWLACNGRIELLVSILQKGEYVDVVDVHGHTALHVACQNGHYQCVIQLLEFRADLNKPNNEGRTPLFFACRHGQLKCVKLLLMKDAEMTPDKNGESPLDVCVEGGYKECIELILMKHPDHMDRLVWLVKQETIPVDKIQSVLEYLCNCNLALMIDVVSRLANVTSTAGMELLSVSSSYQDLMPQFLRYIRVLCSLYSYYIAAQQKHDSAGLHTLPRESPPSSGSRVRRTDSLGSTLDSPRSRGSSTRTFLSSWSGHNRANSHGGSIELAELQLERENMVSASLGNLLSAEFPSDPLDQLEVVWISLSSWYDLLMKEIEKIEGETSNVIEKEAPTNNSPPSSSESSQLAAAIILSAPPKRRQIFLHATNSTEERLGSAINDKALKRRSWHVERVAHLIALEDYSSLPTFQRSASSELPQSHDIKTDTILEEPTNNTSTTPEDKPDIVGVYADRLSAVTHAFSICCNAKLKSIRKSGLHSRFLEFVDIYEPVLKVLLARCPQLIFAHFHFLLESTELLRRFIHIVHAQPFDDRKKWFYENLYKDTPPDLQLTLTPQDEIIVDRENIFTTSCSKISDASVDRLKTRLAIRFEGEAGMGAGVHREWFSNLSREILNPDYALFTQSADGATFQPNSHSDVNPDHLSYFKFAGRTMALALYHQQLLNVYFTRSFYKHILGISVSYKDVESIDPEYASNLQWLLDNEIDTLDLGLTFSLETDVFGATEIIELKPHGCDITVTDQNKAEYVQLVTEMRMTQAIGPQISSFKEGFYELIPHHLISLFDEYELELLLSGLPDIDVDDWEKNTEYNGYNEEMEIIKWFWEVVKEFDKKELAILLQFVTGSSRVPHGGFANLVGASGLTKFTVSRLDYVPNRLPLASTCFNLLKLPEYPSKEMLKERLQFALTCGIGVIDIT